MGIGAAGLGKHPGWKEQVRRPWAAPGGIWTTLRGSLRSGPEGRGPHSGCSRSLAGWNEQVLEAGRLLRFSAAVPGAQARQTGEGSGME